MKYIGKVKISKECIADILMLCKGRLLDICKDKENTVMCVIESNIFPKGVKESETAPEYEIYVTEDAVGNQIIESERLEERKEKLVGIDSAWDKCGEGFKEFDKNTDIRTNKQVLCGKCNKIINPAKVSCSYGGCEINE